MKRVAIAGGGLAGLTCAYALKQRGIDATVFESAPEPGGRDAASFFLLAADLFRNTFQLIQHLGLADDLVSIAPYAGQAYKGRIYRHRVASTTGLLTFKGLNIADKALLPRMAYLLARHGSSLNFHHPERGLEFDAESVASYVKRQLSQNVLNYVAGPLISTLFYYGSEETSAWLYMILAKHMYNVRMSTIRGGIQRLSRRLAEETRVLSGRPVSRVVSDGAAYLIDGELFSHLVVAVPGDAVLRIEGMSELLSGEDRKFFEDCRYQRIVSVNVATERPIDGGCYAVAIPRVENMSAATISFHDYIDPSTVPEGRGLLTVSGGGATVSPAQLMEDLAKLYRVESQGTEGTGTFEWTSGMPKFPAGRYRQIVDFNGRRRRDGLAFCGDYLLGPFIEGAVTTALRAAEAIQSDMS